MERKSISRQVRNRVRERANQRCEYCRLPDGYSSGPFVCEHVIPRVRGAGDTFDELAWSCAGCNSHKNAKTHVTDPVTGNRVPIYNPRKQVWEMHFSWSENGLLMLRNTVTGRGTVESICLNRPELVNLRFVLTLISEHPPP